MKKLLTFALFLLSINVVFAQTQNPCTLQESEGTMYIVCDVCGDGIKGGSERCDDGNTANGDGCSSSCSDENAQPEEETSSNEQTMLLETGPEEGTNPPGQTLPGVLLGAGPTEEEIISMKPQAQAFQEVIFPEHIQPTGAPRLASIIAARNNKAQNTQASSTLGGASFILPQQLAATGGVDNILALVMILVGVLGVRGSLKLIK